jgi:hypothetical protein
MGGTKVEGAEVGGRIKVYSEVSPGRAFPVRVGVDDQRRVTTWTGGMPWGYSTELASARLRGVIEEHWRASLLQVKELAETEERGRDQT